MNIYLLIYCCLIIYALFSLSNSVQYRNILFIFSVLTVGLLLIIISGIRDTSIGTDTVMYKRIFNEANWHNFLCLRYEKGFLLFVILSKKILNNFNFFLLCYSIFFIFLTLYPIKKYYNSYGVIILYLFVCIIFFRISFNAMRTGIANAILIIGYPFIKEKKYFKFILIVIFASLFHYSSLLGLLLLFSNRIKKENRIYIIILYTIAILSMMFKLDKIAMNMLINSVSGYYKHYFSNLNDPKGVSFGMIFYFVVIVYCLIRYDNLSKRVPFFEIILTSIMVTNLSMLFFNSYTAFSDRISLVFKTPIYLLLPYIITDRKNKIEQAFLLFLLIAIGYYYYWILLNGSDYSPYVISNNF